MTTSKLPRFVKPEVDKVETPVEVNNLKWLLSDNWWKLLVEYIDKQIKEARDNIEKPIPLWLSDEQTKIWYADIERIKLKTQLRKELKELPYEILREYWETEFEVDMSKEV